MGRVQRGAVTITGKYDGHIITRAGKYVSHTRPLPEKGSKKDEPALKQQYSRTGYLNRLASGINAAVQSLAGKHKSTRFYINVQKRFRREPGDNRLLLLRRLRGMDIHPAYPFSRFNLPEVVVHENRKGLLVKLSVISPPPPQQDSVDSYAFQVSLLTWNRKDMEPDCQLHCTKWVPLSGGLPDYEFQYNKPTGAVHWILCVRIEMGKQERADNSLMFNAMQIVNTGSFDKREQAWLRELDGEEKQKEDNALKPDLTVRVAASGMRERRLGS